MAISISASSFNNAWNCIRRAAKIAPDFIVGTGNEAFSKTLTNSFRGVKGIDGKRTGGLYFKNFWTQLKNAVKASEKHNASVRRLHGGFWKDMWYQLKTTPKLIGKSWKVGAKAATTAGKNSFIGGLKGSLGAIGKRLPLLGGVLMLAAEVKNINGGMKEGGLLGGAKEAGKSIARVGTGMVGMAIGTALIPVPVVGSIIGYMAGDWLAKLVVGKNYTERQAEAEAAANAAKQVYSSYNSSQASGNNFDTGSTNPFVKDSINPFTTGAAMSPEEIMKLQMLLQSGYGLNNDFLGQTISYKN